MPEVRITVRGIDEVVAKFREMPVKVIGAIGSAIAKSGFILEAESKRAITTGPTRAILTGLLRSQLVVRELTRTRVSVYPLVKYGIFVHEGTKYMRARPFFDVAKDKAEGQVMAAFNDEIAQALL